MGEQNIRVSDRNVEYSEDGSLIMVKDSNGHYHIYQFEVASDGSHPEDTDQPADAESDEIGTEENSETWICPNCQTENRTKFCTECGEKKPFEDETWICENGHEGNTGKFCGECGAPRP